MKSSSPVMPFPRRALPPMMRVRQILPSDYIQDVRNNVRQKLMDFGFQQKVKPGHRVAVTADSRGIGGFVELLSGICDAVKACRGVSSQRTLTAAQARRLRLPEPSVARTQKRYLPALRGRQTTQYAIWFSVARSGRVNAFSVFVRRSTVIRSDVWPLLSLTV